MIIPNVETYHLNLNGYNKILESSWKELQMHLSFCDVTLSCENGQIEAHKGIISSFSQLFRNLLKLDQSQHPIIHLMGVTYKELQSILNFMYQGEVNINFK